MANAIARAMDKSAELLRSAADEGDNEAQFALGLLYLLGRGVEKNAGEAFRLFSLALDAGDAQAAHFRDMAADHLAQDRGDKGGSEDAAGAALKEARRRQRFPKPKLVKNEE